MSTIDDVKVKLESSETLDKALSDSFSGVFSCTRVLSAWGHNTMTPDDFAPFEKGDEAFDEFSKNIKKALTTEKVDNMDKLYDFIGKQLEVYELFYNPNIDSEFYPDAFREDFIGELDFDKVLPAIKKYQEVNFQKVDEPKIKTVKNKI